MIDTSQLRSRGRGTLIPWLLDDDLVDELNLLIFPVVVGQGTRLFANTSPDRALELLGSRTTPSGVGLARSVFVPQHGFDKTGRAGRRGIGRPVWFQLYVCKVGP